MTSQLDIIGDPLYTSVLNHGFVGLVETMPGLDDERTFTDAIVQAARVSYGKGTKKASTDRGLMRYLLNHWHTTPFEMVEVKFHCKMPIFVARQWIRHRTANVNEYSGRYSVMVDEFYVPELDVIQPQSTQNHQGRAGTLSLKEKKLIQQEFIDSNNECYDRYKRLLNEDDQGNVLHTDFDGIAKEIARGVLSVNNYTEWYWKIDLHNLMHFLRLRIDSHAQHEIQVFGLGMYDLLKKTGKADDVLEAFQDYRVQAKNLSRMEVDLVQDIIAGKKIDFKDVNAYEKELKSYGLTKREIEDFVNKMVK